MRKVILMANIAIDCTATHIQQLLSKHGLRSEDVEIIDLNTEEGKIRAEELKNLEVVNVLSRNTIDIRKEYHKLAAMSMEVRNYPSINRSVIPNKYKTKHHTYRHQNRHR